MTVLRLLISILFLQTSFFINFCHAAVTSMVPPVDDMEVTSPFGWRVHPIYGTEKYHCGVDLGIDSGDPIYATADGIIIFAGDGDDGYGNQVMINHGDDLLTRYAHNSALTVKEGQRVSKGQQIAYGGSTGNSTGPHCHLEVILNGEVTDPGNYIPGLKALEIAEGQVNGVGGGAAAPVPSGKVKGGYDNHGSAMDKIANTDTGKHIRDIVTQCVEVITKALKVIQSAVAEIFMILLTMDLAIGAMKKSLEASGPDVSNDSFVVWLIHRVVLYGFLMFLLNNWGDIVGNLSLYGFPNLGAIALSTDMDSAGKILSDPTQIIQKGIKIINPIMADILKPKGIIDFGILGMFGTPLLCLCAFLWCVFFGLFSIIGLQLARAYLEFYFVILFSFTGFMFSGIKYMRKYASNGLNGVFIVSINLMFYIMFATMLAYTMENLAGSSFHTSNRVEKSFSNTESNKITNASDLMARIRSVESVWGNYHYDNGKGCYGAYQINKEYFDIWCEEYEKNNNTPALDTDANYKRSTESGPYNTKPEPTNTKYPWSQRNQDLIARYILTSYYNKYGSWEAAGRAWSQGESGINSAGAKEYENKLLEVKGDHSDAPVAKNDRIVNLSLLLQLLILCLVFFFMGDRISSMVKRQFGTPGFKLTQDEDMD